jgi:DNA (cytosine-5)-methyltransferase 1
MNELALFAGAGGGILGGHLLGWRTVCAVEWEPYAASVLAARQNDGLLPPFPIWDDVQTFDGRPWRGCVDVVSGGFPCQDISVAGKGAGIDGARSGMWGHMARIVGEVRPRYVFVENSPALLTRGLSRVLGDLAALGYDCRWTVLGAADVGAPHQRDRFWLVAHASGNRPPMEQERDIGRMASQGREKEGAGGQLAICASSCSAEVADAASIGQQATRDAENHSPTHGNREAGWTRGNGQVDNAYGAQRQGDECPQRIRPEHADIERTDWWQSEPDVGRVAHGVAARVDRLKAIGNGQVPLCAATAFKLLTETE